MKVYISGKISGLDIHFAQLKFLYSEEYLIRNGFYPINPFKINPASTEKNWKECMVDDIKALFDCNAIFMQKDWGQSKGARIEYMIAKELGLKIMFEEE